eukprot:c20330_g1_i1.p1 GENE.c20330_g1_i1~~c20330_g1_i1.p1  ORF type:complete len:290 (-),score=59.18 c20330_g1_i1:364-1233(-)
MCKQSISDLTSPRNESTPRNGPPAFQLVREKPLTPSTHVNLDKPRIEQKISYGQQHSPPRTYKKAGSLSSFRAHLFLERKACLAQMAADAEILTPLVTQAKRLAAQQQRPSPTQSPTQSSAPTTCKCSLAHQNAIEQSGEVTITWRPTAENPCPRIVQVSWELDSWSHQYNMQSTAASEWSLKMPVILDAPIQFKFVVDGVWQTSPNYSTTLDPSGNRNNIAIPKLVEFSGSDRSNSVVSMRCNFDGWALDHSMKMCSVSQKYNVVALMSPGVNQIKVHPEIFLLPTRT